MDPKLTQLLNSFLVERRESSGGFAPVTEKDWEQLHQIVERLLELKFGPDPDGDLPVNYMLINRHVHGPIHFMRQPYFIRAKTDDEWEAAFMAATTNLSIALDEVNKAFDMRRIQRRGK